MKIFAFWTLIYFQIHELWQQKLSIKIFITYKTRIK